jgi:hypothetical protein
MKTYLRPADLWLLRPVLLPETHGVQTQDADPSVPQNPLPCGLQGMSAVNSEVQNAARALTVDAARAFIGQWRMDLREDHAMGSARVHRPAQRRQRRVRGIRQADPGAG